MASTAILAISYFLLASASILLTRFEGGAAFLWPATAPLFAFLVIRHPQEWFYPIAASGAASFAASSLFGLGPIFAVPLAIAIVAEAALPALLLRKIDADLSSFDNIPSLVKFILVAGIIGPAASGIVGAETIALRVGHDFWPNWRAWFAAHSLGTISIAPLLLLVMQGDGLAWLRASSVRNKIEAIALLLLVAATSFGVFEQREYPLLFLPMLPLIMTTFRLGRVGAAGAVVVLATIGGGLTLLGHGPISLMHGSIGARAQFFQFYLAIAVLMVLPVAAELRRREALVLTVRQTGAAYRLLAENLGDTLIHTSLDGDVRFASPAILELTGYKAADVVGRNSRNFVLAEDFAVFFAAREKAIAEPDRTTTIEYRAKVRDDVVIWCETRMRSYTNEKGTPIGVILVVRDVTARKAAEAELALEATTDALTGLPNRRAFFSRLRYLRQEVASGQGAGCIAIFDIDHFKTVNDTHGHASGDRVLATVAHVAQAAIRSGDMVARIGGEEFGMVLWGASIEAAMQTCERVRAAIAHAAVSSGPGANIRVTASFGAAAIRSGADDDAIYDAADQALYAAKASGRNRLRVAN
ncbi:GGDEF domain-containing protein [Sphingomonas abietis]|uniref:diguanylate cyclase n=1 Tax=Sphingomonas abietis TaxID=3012344 RepID=A0ABY7NHH5_9SPHN|nr:diguanylate cyclase [Sphingomonas abietis]WBO20778.1 diguanylate cyclase [Sphingomonas abietis]